MAFDEDGTVYGHVGEGSIILVRTYNIAVLLQLSASNETAMPCHGLPLKSLLGRLPPNSLLRHEEA